MTESLISHNVFLANYFTKKGLPVLFELRQYRVKPGQMDGWIKFMEETIIPFQTSKGMVVVAAFTGETEEDLYVWIRRFDDEETRVQLYKDVYETDYWKNEIAPQVGDMIDRSKTVVTRLNPTPQSVIR
jgi:hypothetical protein